MLYGSVVKDLPANVRDASSIPGSGRSPGGGDGNPLQDSVRARPFSLARRQPQTETLGELWSKGSHRVRYDLATKTKTCSPTLPRENPRDPPIYLKAHTKTVGQNQHTQRVTQEHTHAQMHRDHNSYTPHCVC